MEGALLPLCSTVMPVVDASKIVLIIMTKRLHNKVESFLDPDQGTG